MLRFVKPEDAPRLLEIYRPYVEHTTISFETEPPSLEEFQRRIATFSARFPYLVAEEDGVILGYAYAHAFHERAAYGWTVETSIYVERGLRGKGLGRRLYQPLLTLLQAQGVRTACAVVTIPNDPSIGFHQALGFRQAGILPQVGYKLGQWHDVAYLIRRLNPAQGAPVPLIPVDGLEPKWVQRVLETASGCF